MKKSVGVIFVYCRAIMPFWTVEDAGPYKEKSNILMRRSLLPVFLFYEKEQDEEEDKVVKAVAAVGEEQDQGEDEKLLRADTAVLAEKRAEPQTRSAL